MILATALMIYIRMHPKSFPIFYFKATSLFTKKPEEGANTQIFLSASAADSLSKGSYYDDMKVAELKPFAKDEVNAKALWEASEKMGGVKFDFETTSVIPTAMVEEEAVTGDTNQEEEESAETETDNDPESDDMDA